MPADHRAVHLFLVMRLYYHPESDCYLQADKHPGNTCEDVTGHPEHEKAWYKQQKQKHFIYVHGANGSGKTTLAYSLLTCAGGVAAEHRTKAGATVSVTDAGIAFVGRYRTATGGADSVHPFSLIPDAVRVALRNSYHVFAEGLMTPGVETCRTMAQYAKRNGATVTFILLDVPIERCTRHVIKRRMRKGNEKPYQNHHLVKKHNSSRNWADNLRAAGLPCLTLTWSAARDYCQGRFGIDASGAIGLLDIGKRKDTHKARCSQTLALVG